MFAIFFWKIFENCGSVTLKLQTWCSKLQKKLRLQNCGIPVAERHFLKNFKISITKVIPSSCGFVIVDLKKICTCPPLVFSTLKNIKWILYIFKKQRCALTCQDDCRAFLRRAEIGMVEQVFLRKGVTKVSKICLVFRHFLIYIYIGTYFIILKASCFTCHWPGPHAILHPAAAGKPI
jgi:hypothetical protein